MLSPKGYWEHLEIFGVITTIGYPWNLRGGGRDAAKHPTRHQTVHTPRPNEDSPTQIVNSAVAVEKPCRGESSPALPQVPTLTCKSELTFTELVVKSAAMSVCRKGAMGPSNSGEIPHGS